MKKIYLTQGMFALVDDIDYKFLMQWKWHYGNGYAKRTSWIPKIPCKQKTIHMHRVILRRILGHNNFLDTDHKNTDRLDNRRDNLRPASRLQNQRNRTSNSGSSKFKGVSWYKRDQKWKAQIRVNGKLKHLGTFDNEVNAAKAYNKAALKHFGEFARFNSID